MNASIINVKGKGRLSAQSIVTVKASVEYYLDDDPEPVFFQVMITASASDLDLFLLPYSDNENADLQIEILNIIQPGITEHDENLKWLDYSGPTPTRRHPRRNGTRVMASVNSPSLIHSLFLFCASAIAFMPTSATNFIHAEFKIEIGVRTYPLTRLDAHLFARHPQIRHSRLSRLRLRPPCETDSTHPDLRLGCCTTRYASNNVSLIRLPTQVLNRIGVPFLFLLRSGNSVRHPEALKRPVPVAVQDSVPPPHPVRRPTYPQTSYRDHLYRIRLKRLTEQECRV